MKENKNTSYKLIRQTKDKNKHTVILDLGVKNVESIVVQYPVYIAILTDEKKLNVVEFSNNGDIKRKKQLQLYENELFTPFSNPTNLVTKISNTSRAGKETLVFHKIGGVNHYLPDLVVGSFSVKFNNFIHTTGFDYDPSSAILLNGVIIYEQTTKIPCNGKSSFGWSVENIGIKNQSLALFQAFDNHGNLRASKSPPSQIKISENMNKSKERVMRVEAFNENNELIIGLLSEVKYQNDNWFYLEIVIDAPFLIGINVNLKNASSESLIKIGIIISPALNSSLHVDHVRFSPLACNFEALVYYQWNQKVVAKIKSNGLLERTFLDADQQTSAIIGEDNILK